MTTAEALAEWAHTLRPSDADLALAQRSLIDTLAVALAARQHPLVTVSRQLGEAGHWAATGHVLDFDDLHMESTAHISVVIVPTVLATDGDAGAYLAGAGVMARLGTALGWKHYQRGWHATCTSGAPGAAVAASLALGLTVEETAHAIGLSVPSAGGIQQSFGTVGKPLQVGFAADAGVRAAKLAKAGAKSDHRVLDEWMQLVGATDSVDFSGDAVPGALAIKLFPCCYAMQRPIGVMRSLADQLDGRSIHSIAVSTPRGTVQPLIHSQPHTGLEGKFSLEYSLAGALLDGFPDFQTFSDEAVRRPAAQELIAKVDSRFDDTDVDNLLAGECRLEVITADGTTVTGSLDFPPGSPQRPPTPEEMAAKLSACGAGVEHLLAGASGEGITWAEGSALLRQHLPASL
ncbi:MmgE/PrpD family protein [Leucobacter sp. USHLN153]|uniref:MmgE/PrpD family protein n=1 Tax=Leucobacter sp. USHLN153 TaxID=3081268 RepID=UPI003016BFB9